MVLTDRGESRPPGRRVAMVEAVRNKASLWSSTSPERSWSSGRTIYVLDEPTIGLHFEDIRKLLGVLNGLVDKGDTVIVIEHNLDVVKTADWVIDMGPEGGSRGGTVVANGTPEDVAKVESICTGQFLAKVLS
jgi:excinuclease ABC subunit A